MSVVVLRIVSVLHKLKEENLLLGLIVRQLCHYITFFKRLGLQQGAFPMNRIVNVVSGNLRAGVTEDLDRTLVKIPVAHAQYI